MPHTKQFPTSEYMMLLQQLDMHYGIFYHLWLMGKPLFSDETDTAAVYFDDAGQCIRFIINESFWNSRTNIQKQFVICHECLHIILEHGNRFFINEDIDSLRANYATDIVVNHMLVRVFGFTRAEVDPELNYCWVDTLFPKDQVPVDNKSAEWYYRKLPKNITEASFPTISTVDDHSDNIFCNRDFKNTIDSIISEMSDDEKMDLYDLLIEVVESKQAGKELREWLIVEVDTDAVKPNKKWESVIREWAMRTIKSNTIRSTQWQRLNRRFSVLDRSLLLPTTMEVKKTASRKDRMSIWFFQDTSGSCMDHAQRFFDAAKSIPSKHFDIKMHCFDTRVFETEIKGGNLYGSGGTQFHPIEAYIQKYIKANNEDYPEAVFVVTDGYGTDVYPEQPNKWYWFLTDNNTRENIPSESHVFLFKNFE